MFSVFWWYFVVDTTTQKELSPSLI